MRVLQVEKIEIFKTEILHLSDDLFLRRNKTIFINLHFFAGGQKSREHLSFPVASLKV